MNLPDTLAFLLSIAVGIGVISTNPARGINRAFFALSIVVAAWLAATNLLTSSTTQNPVFWLRMTNAIGAFIPAFMCMVKDAAYGHPFNRRSFLTAWRWFGVSTFLAVLAFTPYFVPRESSPEHSLRGPGWRVYFAVLGLSYLVLLVQAWRDARRLQGINKIEMLTLLVGGATAGIVGVAFSTLGHLIGYPGLPRLLPVVIVATYAVIAWTIANHKIFNARYLFQNVLRTTLFAGLTLVVLGIFCPLGDVYIPHAENLVLTATLVTAGFYLINKGVSRIAQTGIERDAEVARRDILAAGRTNIEKADLAKAFASILTTWGPTAKAHFLFSTGSGGYSDDDGAVTLLDADACAELLTARWATPEGLVRQRSDRGRAALLEFLLQHHIGVIVSGPMGPGTTPLFVALTQRHDRHPFSYHEVLFLQEWAVLIEGAFARVDLSRQARHSAQLATAGLLGASLAHEIRNPLVAIQTIAQHARTRYGEEAFRNLLVEVVPRELQRIDHLVNGLMDLGRPQAPRFEPLQLNTLVEEGLQVVRPQALDARVELTTEHQGDPTLSGDRRQLQSMLLNLVMNGIQALETTEGPRRIVVRTRSAGEAVELEVADNGPGVPLDMRKSLFEPFTTRNKAKGIGLGLAIVADFVRAHNGKISLVDTSQPGTTFLISLPCQQPSF